MPITWPRSSKAALPSRTWVRVPIMSTMPSSTAEGDEPSVEPGGLPDQGQADDAGRDQHEEGGDPAQDLALGRAAGGEQAPVLGRQQLPRTFGGGLPPGWLGSDVGWPVDGAEAPAGGGGAGLLDEPPALLLTCWSSIACATEPRIGSRPGPSTARNGWPWNPRLLRPVPDCRTYGVAMTVELCLQLTLGMLGVLL